MMASKGVTSAYDDLKTIYIRTRINPRNDVVVSCRDQRIQGKAGAVQKAVASAIEFAQRACPD